MLIGDNSVVSINYTLKDDDGEILDQSPEGEPMVYLHGVGGIIPGLEAELTGKVAGGEFRSPPTRHARSSKTPTANPASI